MVPEEGLFSTFLPCCCLGGEGELSAYRRQIQAKRSAPATRVRIFFEGRSRGFSLFAKAGWIERYPFRSRRPSRCGKDLPWLALTLTKSVVSLLFLENSNDSNETASNEMRLGVEDLDVLVLLLLALLRVPISLIHLYSPHWLALKKRGRFSMLFALNFHP